MTHFLQSLAMAAVAFAAGLGACAERPPPRAARLERAAVESVPVVVESAELDAEVLAPWRVSAPSSPPLPAGIYFRHHTYKPCKYVQGTREGAGLCATPSHVLIAGVFPDARAASTTLVQLDAAGLPPGYPFVAHTDELGMASARDGVVVVMGLYDDQDVARAWQRAYAHVGGEVLPLLGVEAAFERLPQGETRAVATRVRPGAEVPAYAGTVEAPSREGELPLRLPPNPDGSHVRRPQQPLRRLCSLPGGAVILAPSELLMFGYYEFMPLRCPDGRDAWVRWKDTMMGVTIYRFGDRYEAVRLVGAECDSPLFETWPWDPEDPRPARVAEVSGHGGC